MFILNGNLINDDKLINLSLIELKQLCKNEGHTKFSKLKKQDIINLLLTPKSEYIISNENYTSIQTSTTINQIINKATIEPPEEICKIISFGKYKNKSFDYVLENDKSYCRWILQQTSIHEGIQQLKKYLIENYKINIPKDRINCSDLTNYYNIDQNFLSLIDNFQIHSVNYYTNFISELKELPSDIKGIFIDYLIRYTINCKLNRTFEDSRCNFILSIEGLIIDEEHIIFLANKFNISTDNIVDCCEEVLHLIKNKLGECYDKLKNRIGDNNDVLNVSLCHSLFFGKTDAWKYFDYFKENDLIEDNSQLNCYIQRKISDKKCVLCNPTLGNSNLKICADGDLIIDDELIDMKCSKRFIGNNLSDFIQLFIYATLYFINKGIKCTKLTIFNPILKYEKYINLSENMDVYEKIVEILQNRII